jgi:hypothetical protein
MYWMTGTIVMGRFGLRITVISIASFKRLEEKERFPLYKAKLIRTV